MNVTQKEIVQRLRCAAAATNPYSYLFNLADEIEANGIAQPQPSQVQALIAEIDGLERIDFDEGGCDYPCSDGDNYRFDDVRAVLNKYRSAK